MQLSAQFQSRSSSPFVLLVFVRVLTPARLDLLDQDSEMQRAMGAADSFDGASSNQGLPREFSHARYPRYNIYSVSTASASLPPAPQMIVSSLAARPRSSLVRAGSLTESKLTANASRRSGGLNSRKDSYDSSE